ncbi:hypothetical protein FGG08_006979 [Glutinoglossum americanum]|uniref:Uncharacterized protein n=1 Tax=Glutinoglossum americanum TaxID=1670608 RepID=A0A9P8I689_9PEZI|nr:hypothetical protein FGG08_006979 [Glutinoglossum americanum]
MAKKKKKGRSRGKEKAPQPDSGVLQPGKEAGKTTVLKDFMKANPTLSVAECMHEFRKHAAATQEELDRKLGQARQKNVGPQGEINALEEFMRSNPTRSAIECMHELRKRAAATRERVRRIGRIPPDPIDNQGEVPHPLGFRGMGGFGEGTRKGNAQELANKNREGNSGTAIQKGQKPVKESNGKTAEGYIQEARRVVSTADCGGETVGGVEGVGGKTVGVEGEVEGDETSGRTVLGGWRDVEVEFEEGEVDDLMLKLVGDLIEKSHCRDNSRDSLRVNPSATLPGDYCPLTRATTLSPLPSSRVSFLLPPKEPSRMDRVGRPNVDPTPLGGTRSRRGRAEDFFDSSVATSGRNGEGSAKETKTARGARSRSTGDRGLRRGERERSASPARGPHSRAGRKRDGDDTRGSGRYERDRSRDRDRRYRSRSRDRYDRRRERSRSREREHRGDRGGRDRDRDRDRDRSEKKLAERGSGRDARHSPRRDAPKAASSRRHNTRSISPPTAVSPRRRTRNGSPKRNDTKPKPDSRKNTPLPSIESPDFGGADDRMDVSEDNGPPEGGDEEDETEAQMRTMMGFGGFGTTKQKKIQGNDIYGVRKDKKTEYRQYIQRTSLIYILIITTMDLLAGVRKEGSRGGRANFKWEDVKDDAHRENYLGHSLKAPVGRWQKGRDLGWYAKGDDGSESVSAEEARREEIRRIKEAEQDALSAALGFKVEPRRRDSSGVMVEEVKRAVKETAGVGDEEEGEGGRGVGFGGVVGGVGGADGGEDILGGIGVGDGDEGGLKGLVINTIITNTTTATAPPTAHANATNPAPQALTTATDTPSKTQTPHTPAAEAEAEAEAEAPASAATTPTQDEPEAPPKLPHQTTIAEKDGVITAMITITGIEDEITAMTAMAVSTAAAEDPGLDPGADLGVLDRTPTVAGGKGVVMPRSGGGMRIAIVGIGAGAVMAMMIRGTTYGGGGRGRIA